MPSQTRRAGTACTSIPDSAGDHEHGTCSIATVMGRAGFGTNFLMIISFVVLGVGFRTLLWFYFSLVKKPENTSD